LFLYDTPLAKKLLLKTIDLLMHTGDPTCWEHYNPLTGEGLGAIDYSWSGIINDLIIRRIIGVQPYPEKVILNPNLSEDWNNIGVENLSVASTKMTLEYVKQNNGIWSVKVKNSGKKSLLVQIKDKYLTIKPNDSFSTLINPDLG